MVYEQLRGMIASQLKVSADRVTMDALLQDCLLYTSCGLPRNMDGTQGGQAQKVRDFAQQLEKAGFSVCYWDERLTTVTAERALLLANMSREGRREKIDMVAAVVILQAFLDAGGMKNLKKDEAHQMDEQKRNNPMDEEMDEENVVELVDEDGQSVRFEHLMTIEHEGDLYVMLTALEATRCV